VSAAMLGRAIDNAFADLDRAAEVARLDREMTRLDRELSELNAIGIRLSAERNPRGLIETILTKAREITHSDAGSLYLVEEADGTRDPPLRPGPERFGRHSVPRRAAAADQRERRRARGADRYHPQPGGRVRAASRRAVSHQPLVRRGDRLPHPVDARRADAHAGGRDDRRAPADQLQARLLGATAAGRPPAEDAIQRFTARHEQLAGSLASQAAVAIQNRRLYENIRELFEGFVKASVDRDRVARSHDPSGHSAPRRQSHRRLATAIDRCATGPYQAHRFTPEEMTELRYAALLHDFGKVGVREQVLVKAKKLLPGELDRIRQRIELIKRGLELRYSARKIEHLEQKGRRSYAAKAKAFDAELAAYVAELDRSLARIVAANEPAVLPRDFAADIERLALDFFEDHLGNRETVITRDEAEILAIPRAA
jgi:GAF domain-containing protein